MPYKVPVGGVFATIYYEFEDAFQVYGDPGTDEDYYLGINKLLGHAVKITRWTESNNVTLLRGLNNIEAANAVDGRYTGEFGLEFAAVGTLDWMEALMGIRNSSPDYDEGKVYEYTKAGVPKSMTFLIMIQNDQDNPHGGDVFIIKGAIMQNVNITINGTDVPLMVTMTCPYATETSFSSDNLPDFYYPSENAFNFGQARAYFWNSSSDASPGEPASFDTFETICEEFTMTIDHLAELIYGIGSRKARDRFYKYLDYTVSVKVYYRDMERFLLKFYGCPEGPINDLVPAFKRIKLVIQNCKTCGDGYRRMEFEFETAKMNTRESTIDIDTAITETYEFKPLHAVIRAWNGESPVPQWHVSPWHIKQGDLVAMHGLFLPDSSPANITIGDELIATVDVNCSGELEYRTTANSEYDYWSIGNHTVCVSAYSGSETVHLCQDVLVTATDVTSIPRIVACPQLFSAVEDDMYGPLNVKGYNFGTSGGCVTATMAVYNATGENLKTKGSKVWPVSGYYDIKSFISGTMGSFDIDTAEFEVVTPGVLIVEVRQTFTAGEYVATDNIYIAEVVLTSSAGTLRTITGNGLKPNETTMLYIEDEYKGTGTTDDYGTVVFEVTVLDGTKTTEVRQRVILTDGSGVLRAIAELGY
jgi:hypothetical protein